jgi:hypothetical protein
MSPDLAAAVRAALNDGRSLAEVEARLLAGADPNGEVAAAAWLYAWAYDALRPTADPLAARIASRANAPASRDRRASSREYGQAISPLLRSGSAQSTVGQPSERRPHGQFRPQRRKSRSPTERSDA